MKIKENFFLKKKILIYGLGISGIACFNFLKDKSFLNVYDDKFTSKYKRLKKYYLNLKEIVKIEFDYIFISPGIDINRCNLTSFLKNNSEKIIS